jgi:lipopolysaccharide transport system permease protein
MRQINLPKVIFPLIAIAQTTLRSGLVLVLLLIFLQLSGYGVASTYAALPVLIIVQFFLICACAIALAAVVPFIPDVSQMIGNAMVLLMFLSGIFFSGKTIPEQYQVYFYMNPMATLLESYRDILLYNAWPDWTRIAVIGILSVAFLFVIIRLIRRLDKVYPKVLP